MSVKTKDVTQIFSEAESSEGKRRRGSVLSVWFLRGKIIENRRFSVGIYCLRKK